MWNLIKQLMTPGPIRTYIFYERMWPDDKKQHILSFFDESWHVDNKPIIKEGNTWYWRNTGYHCPHGVQIEAGIKHLIKEQEEAQEAKTRLERWNSKT